MDKPKEKDILILLLKYMRVCSSSFKEFRLTLKRLKSKKIRAIERMDTINPDQLLDDL